MRKFFSLAAVSAFALMSAPAFASPAVNVALDLTAVGQASGSTVNQTAAAVDVAIGSVTNSNIDATAINGNNMASVDKDIDQTAGTIANVAADATLAGQVSVSPVTQRALAITGSGGLSGSNSSALAANLNNQASVSVKVVGH
jgi:hypothetical protein